MVVFDSLQIRSVVIMLSNDYKLGGWVSLIYSTRRDVMLSSDERWLNFC